MGATIAFDANERKYQISSAKDECLIDQKQEVIVKGALELFYEQGFYPTTIRQIAEKCGMSMGQLYHYISSKDDVLYLVHLYFHDLWFAYGKAHSFNHYTIPMQRLVIFLKTNLTFVEEHRKLIQFISNETQYINNDYLKCVLKMEQNTTIQMYRNLLEDVNRENPIIGDLDIMASVLTYTISFYALKSWSVKTKPIEKINREILRFCLKGIGTQVYLDAVKYI